MGLLTSACVAGIRPGEGEGARGLAAANARRRWWTVVVVRAGLGVGRHRVCLGLSAVPFHLLFDDQCVRMRWDALITVVVQVAICVVGGGVVGSNAGMRGEGFEVEERACTCAGGGGVIEGVVWWWVRYGRREHEGIVERVEGSWWIDGALQHKQLKREDICIKLNLR